MDGTVEYDDLYVTIRRDKLDDCLRYYRALGWEVFSFEEHKVYYNLFNIVLRRPHKIEGKDELQLLQVYLETALNSIGRLERKPRPLTVTVVTVFTVLIAGLITVGLCFALLSDLVTYIIIGWICVGLGIFLIIPAVPVTVVLYRLDGLYASAGRLAADREIGIVCARAEQLTSGLHGKGVFLSENIKAEEDSDER